MKCDGDTKYNWSAGNSSAKLGNGNGRAGNRRTSRDDQAHSFSKIGHNTEKSLVSRGDLLSLKL